MSLLPCLYFLSFFIFQTQGAIKQLTMDAPVFITCLDEIPVNSGITICVNPKNETLQLLLTHMYPSNDPLKAYSLYDSSDLSNFTLTLDSPELDSWSNSTNLPRSLYSHSSCFTIQKTQDAPANQVRVMFRIVQAYYTGCILLDKNVFDANGNSGNNGEIGFIADTQILSKCETVILAACTPLPLLSFSTLTVTTTDPSISSVAGFEVVNTINRNMYFPSDYDDFSKKGPYYNFSIYAPSVSIVTIGTTVVGKVKVNNPPPRITFSGTTKIQGIMASPLFGGIVSQSNDPYSYRFSTDDNSEASVILIMREFAEGSGVVLTDGQKNYTMKANDRLTLKTSRFDMFNSNSNKYLLHYSISKDTSNDSRSPVVFIAILLSIMFLVLTI